MKVQAMFQIPVSGKEQIDAVVAFLWTAFPMWICPKIPRTEVGAELLGPTGVFTLHCATDYFDDVIRWKDHLQRVLVQLRDTWRVPGVSAQIIITAGILV